MAMTSEQLHKAVEDPRLARQPAWVQQLIVMLDLRLRYEEGSRQRTEQKAAEEVEAARALLNEGPADSDTFLWLPASAVSDSGWSENDDAENVRPLGQGVTVEFRAPGMDAGCGYEVSMQGGRLQVRGINQLTVRPEISTVLTIGND